MDVKCGAWDDGAGAGGGWVDNLPCFRHRCTCIEHIARASSGISQVHQRVMHQPINERVTNLVATRQETTLEQIHKYANTQIQETVLDPGAKHQTPGLEQQPALLNSLAFSPMIKQEGLAGEEGKANDRGLQEQEVGSSLERGEISPKVELVSDGASLVCRTCNKVRDRLLTRCFHSAPSAHKNLQQKEISTETQPYVQWVQLPRFGQH